MDPTDPLPAPLADAPLTERPGDPPVVARLVVEIRSDGTRTIARGALEDRLTGQTVGLQAEGASPAALAVSLLRAIPRLPAFGAAARGALLRLLTPPRR